MTVGTALTVPEPVAILTLDAPALARAIFPEAPFAADDVKRA